MMEKLISKFSDYLYFIFRVFVGLLFFQHGAQKLFGWFSERPPAELFSLMGLAGVVEFAGGLAIALGLFTRPVALICAIQMLFAYFMVHASKGLIPIVNKGELALLYFAAFLVITAYGAKKWGIEKLLFKKELF